MMCHRGHADVVAARLPVRSRLRFAVACASSLLLLCATVALLSSQEAAASVPGGRNQASLGEWLVLTASSVLEGNASRNSTQDLAQMKPRLSFYEKFMQRLANLNVNTSEAQNGTECEDNDEECIPAEATRVSALQITGNMADDWEVRNPQDHHPFQFCAEYSDLTAKELRECLTHLMKPIELARSEPIARNGTDASLELAAETNRTFNVTEEGGWDSCYEAFAYPEDKATCLTFVTNKLKGDLAFACTKLDTTEQRFKCQRVAAAVKNVKDLIRRQEVVPSELSKDALVKEQNRMQATMDMQDEENATETALQKMSPELNKMLQKTIDISDESNDKLTSMEQAINETLLSGPQTAFDRLGPKPGPFGELPGNEEHDYMVAKALASNLSSTAAAAEAADANTSVDVAKAEMRAIINRGYNGAGDSIRALRLMKTPGGITHPQAAAISAVDQTAGGTAALHTRAKSNLAYTETLLQIGSSKNRANNLAGRLQGLVQLEKLAMHGNLGDLDSIMNGVVQAPQEDVSEEQMEDAKIAAAFGDDGSKFLHNQNDAGKSLFDSNAYMHVPPRPAPKSAANIAAQFRTDSVSTVVPFADDGSEDMDKEPVGDLGDVMDGTTAVHALTPSAEMRQTPAIAQMFDADGRVAGKLATQWMGSGKKEEIAPPAYSFDKSFVHIYKKLMSNGNAELQRIKLLRADEDNRVPSGALPINANDVQTALEPTAPEGHESTRQAWLKRWLQKTRDETDAADGQSMVYTADGLPTATRHRLSSSSDSQDKGTKRSKKTPMHKNTEAANEGNDMNSLWNKLLDEEAMAKTAKYEANVAKEQAAIAGRKIEEREREKRVQASEREEANMRSDEAKVAEDKHDAAVAKRQADEVAHRLAEQKFLAIQAAENKAKQPRRGQELAKEEATSVTAEREQQQVVQGHLTAKRLSDIRSTGLLKAAIVRQAKANAKAAEKEAEKRAFTKAAAWEAFASAATKASSKVQQVARMEQQKALVMHAKQMDRGLDAAAAHASAPRPADTKDLEATIVATVKRLELKAEHEPVVTKQEQDEQRNEVEEAKKFLEQAALLKQQRAIVRPEIITKEKKWASAQEPMAVAGERAPVIDAPVIDAMPGAATLAQPVMSPAARVQDRKSRVATDFDKVSTDKVGTISQDAQDGNAATAARVHALALVPGAIPVLAPAVVPAAAHTQSVQPSLAVRPERAVATAAKAAPAKLSSLDKAKQMEIQLKKEDAQEEAKVADLVKSFSNGGDDGIGGDGDGGNDHVFAGLEPAKAAVNVEKSVYAAGQRATMAQIHALSKQASAADSDGSNLGDLMSIMAAPPPTSIAAAFQPVNIASHHHMAKIDAEVCQALSFAPHASLSCPFLRLDSKESLPSQHMRSG